MSTQYEGEWPPRETEQATGEVRSPDQIRRTPFGSDEGWGPQYAVPPPPPKQLGTNGLAVAALALGVPGILFGFVPLTFWVAGTLGTIGLILGLVGLSKARRRVVGGKKLAIAGVVTSALALVLAVVGAVIFFKAVSDFGNEVDNALGVQSLPSASVSPSDEASATQESTPPPPDLGNSTPPKPSDFRLKLLITDKQCFGDAGCSVSYKVDLASVASSVDSEFDGDVTYTVKGCQDGNVTGTISFFDGEYVPDEGFCDTVSSSKKLTVVTSAIS